MIYYVSNNKELFESDLYQIMSVEYSIYVMSSWELMQVDTETTGKDCHINKLLLIQFGNKKDDIQIVVDLTSVDILLYKDLIESKLCIFQNAKFDLQFLYNYHIIPLRIYDTMIAEQVLNLGFKPQFLGMSNSMIIRYLQFLDEYPQWSKIKNKQSKKDFIYSIIPDVAEFMYNYTGAGLKAICKRRLNINVDKTIQSQIPERGIDPSVIVYAAHDVMYLEDIMWLQIAEARQRQCFEAVKLECQFVNVIAYMEWCGIRLDVPRWKKKMERDLENLNKAKEALNNFVINHPNLQEFTFRDYQGDLFAGFNTEKQCSIVWTSSEQVIKVAKKLGFNTKVESGENGEDKDSVIEKHLKKQKGICDEFLKLYFGKGDIKDEDYFAGHQGSAKVVSSFGQGHLNAINPNTNRIHTVYKQLGADTGRMSSGSTQINIDLARVKGLPTKPNSEQRKKGLACCYPNMQQLPNDAETRACFIPNDGNMWISCDYSAIESRLGADIYQEKAMIDEFLHGSGDMHSLVAKMIFPELKDVEVKDIKRLYPHLRNNAKPVEFSQQFGGTAEAIRNSMGCSIEESENFAKDYNSGFKGIAAFKKKGARLVKSLGYIVLSPLTGHKTFWWDWCYWKENQKLFNSNGFWDEYRKYHKGTGDKICKLVSNSFKTSSKWERKALNSVTQGQGAVILKDSQIRMFYWVLENNLFGKVLLNNLTHDEANWEAPKEIYEKVANKLQELMEYSASIYCKSLPIPAEPQCSDHWVH